MGSISGAVAVAPIGEHRRSGPIWLFLALGTIGATLASEARAGESAPDKALAQALFDQARELLARGNAAEACPKLEESQRLDPTSGTLINLADCYEKQGKLATAWSTFLQVAPAANAAGHPDRERVARDRALALAPRLSKIVVHPNANEAGNIELQRDGVPIGRAEWDVPIPVDPGEHRIAAFLSGNKSWEAVVSIKIEGEMQTVYVPLLEGSRLPAAGEPRGLGGQRVAALVSGAVGVAGLVAGTAFGLASQSRRSEADDHCTGSMCRDQAGVDLRADAKRAGNLSTAGFIVGAVGLAGGAVLWFTASDHSGSARVGVGFGSVALTGTW